MSFYSKCQSSSQLQYKIFNSRLQFVTLRNNLYSSSQRMQVHKLQEELFYLPGVNQMKEDQELMTAQTGQCFCFFQTCHTLASYVLFGGPSGRCTLEETYYQVRSKNIHTLHSCKAFIILFKALIQLNEVEQSRKQAGGYSHTQTHTYTLWLSHALLHRFTHSPLFFCSLKIPWSWIKIHNYMCIFSRVHI